MALRNSSSHDDSNPNGPAMSVSSSISNAEQRSILFAKMGQDLDENGAVFLPQGETSQSLSLSDIFTLKDGTVTPVLKGIREEYIVAVLWKRTLVCTTLVCFMPCITYLQVPATETKIKGEASAIKIVAKTICPLNIVLDRVVLTSTGVLLGCCQVVSGTDPVTIRTKLKTALPRAPEKQLHNEVMLHTSFARLLGRPNNLPEEGQKVSGLQIFHELVNRVNNQIRGMNVAFSFVIEP